MSHLNLGCSPNMTSSGMNADLEAPSIGSGFAAGMEKLLHPNLEFNLFLSII